jgi:uncharacterized protein DUF2154
MHKETVTIALDGARAGQIQLDIGVGELRVARTSRSGVFIEGSIDLPDDVELEQRNSTRDGVAHCTLSARFPRHSVRGLRDKPRWELRLGADVPIELKVKAGAGASTLDLSGLQLTDLDIEAGVGETKVTFPDGGRARARIKSGVGETVVSIPESLEARVRVQSGIGSVKVDSRFQRQASGWASVGYDDAAERLDLRVEAGVGSTSVRSSSMRGTR